MKVDLDCIPCFIKQTFEVAKIMEKDKATRTKIVKEVLNHLSNVNLEEYTPPQLSREVHDIIRKIANCKDPYKKVKDQSNKMANKMYPSLKEIVDKSKDPLLTSIKLAIVGNVIDFGTSNRFNINEKIDEALNKEFEAIDYPYFKEKLNKSETILYLADNTGEIFFDRLLLEQLYKAGKKIVYAVKSNPIINDATKEDALFAKIDEFATIIKGDKGQEISAPGFLIPFSSEAFLEKFNKSDMVISKGQGNFESLNNSDREIFFLLMAKCPLVSNELGVELGKLVLKVEK